MFNPFDRQPKISSNKTARWLEELDRSFPDSYKHKPIAGAIARSERTQSVWHTVFTRIKLGLENFPTINTILDLSSTALEEETQSDMPHNVIPLNRTNDQSNTSRHTS